MQESQTHIYSLYYQVLLECLVSKDSVLAGWGGGGCLHLQELVPVSKRVPEVQVWWSRMEWNGMFSVVFQEQKQLGKKLLRQFLTLKK